MLDARSESAFDRSARGYVPIGDLPRSGRGEPSRRSRATGPSTGCVCLTSTRRACSPQSWTPTARASRCGPRSPLAQSDDICPTPTCWRPRSPPRTAWCRSPRDGVGRRRPGTDARAGPASRLPSWGALAGGFVGTLVLTTALRTANELGFTRRLPLSARHRRRPRSQARQGTRILAPPAAGEGFALVYYAIFAVIDTSAGCSERSSGSCTESSPPPCS